MSCLCFATDKYLPYVEEAKHRQEGCIGDRIPRQLWRGALVPAIRSPEKLACFFRARAHIGLTFPAARLGFRRKS